MSELFLVGSKVEIWDFPNNFPIKFPPTPWQTKGNLDHFPSLHSISYHHNLYSACLPRQKCSAQWNFHVEETDLDLLYLSVFFCLQMVLILRKPRKLCTYLKHSVFLIFSDTSSIQFSDKDSTVKWGRREMMDGKRWWLCPSWPLKKTKELSGGWPRTMLNPRIFSGYYRPKGHKRYIENFPSNSNITHICVNCTENTF